jgi:SEC-C motif
MRSIASGNTSAAAVIGRDALAHNVNGVSTGRKAHGGMLQMAHKIGRNDPCICGSGQKYKRCCFSPQNLASLAKSGRCDTPQIPADIPRIDIVGRVIETDEEWNASFTVGNAFPLTRISLAEQASPEIATVAISIRERDSDFLVVYDNETTNTCLQVPCATRREALSCFKNMKAIIEENGGRPM